LQHLQLCCKWCWWLTWTGPCFGRKTSRICMWTLSSGLGIACNAKQFATRFSERGNGTYCGKNPTDETVQLVFQTHTGTCNLDQSRTILSDELGSSAYHKNRNLQTFQGFELLKDLLGTERTFGRWKSRCWVVTPWVKHDGAEQCQCLKCNEERPAVLIS